MFDFVVVILSILGKPSFLPLSPTTSEMHGLAYYVRVSCFGVLFSALLFVNAAISSASEQK